MNKVLNWTIVGIAIGFALLWLIIDREDKKKQLAEIKGMLESDPNLDAETKRRIEGLLEKNPDLDKGLKKELQAIGALVNIKMETKAILNLAKVIETLLGKLYAHSPDFKTWLKAEKRRNNFESLIEYAWQQKVLTQEQYHHLNVLRIVRNEEAHETNVVKDKLLVVSAFLTGFLVTHGLHEILRNKTKEEPAIA